MNMQQFGGKILLDYFFLILEKYFLLFEENYLFSDLCFSSFDTFIDIYGLVF